MTRLRLLAGVCLVGALAVGSVGGAASADPVPRPSPPTASAESGAQLYSTTSMQLILLERRSGPAAALEELDRRITSDPRLGGVCHAVAHDLGHEALEEADGDVGRALAARDDVCGGGYTHGIIEVALGASAHPAKDLLTLCAPRQDGSCFHGIGHGAMFATGMNVKRALRLCDRAPTTLLAGRCGEGVFMQLFSSDVSGMHTTGAPVPTLASARRTCAETRARYAPSCWFYAPTIWLADRPDDFSGAMTWCASAPGAVARQLCAKGVGSRTIKYHPEDPRIGAAVCSAAGDLTDPCLSGMGSYWSVHFRGARAPSDICRHLGSQSLAGRCRTVLRG